MKLKKLMSLVAVMAMVVTTLTGCSSASDSNLVVVNLGSEPSKLNSVLATGSVDGNVFRQCMLGLTALNEKDEAIPGVAKDWEISEDKMEYTFNLREGMKWSNGEEVTANDFRYALDLLFDARNGATYASTWAPIFVGGQELFDATSKETIDEQEVATAFENLGVVVVDDYTLKMNITAPYTYFEGLLAFMNFYPVNQKAVEDAGGLDKYATEAENIVTNGPFNLTEWNHEDSIMLEKNEDFYDAENIKLEAVKLVMIKDSNTWLNEFNAGTLDMTKITGDQSFTLREEGTTVPSYDDGSAWYLEYNTNNPGLNNAKVRKALTIGLDAQTYVDVTAKNESKVANSYVPAAILAGTFQAQVGNLINRPTDGDYSEAKALLEEGLAEEGLTLEDFSVTILADEGDSVKVKCEYIQEAIRKNLGATVNIEQITYKARLDRMDKKEFDIVMAGWGPDYNDPMTFMDLWVTGGGNNHTSWGSERYDELIELARTEADVATRDAYFIEAEKILADESPIGMTHWRSQDILISSRLKGVVTTAFQDLDLTGAYLED